MTARLKINDRAISNYFRRAYITDLIDEKKIKWLRDKYRQSIRSTPEVCHSGYRRIATGKLSISYQQAIWVDVGGATTDIYFPRLSQSNNDGVSISMGPTGRFVLVSTGFKHSASQTLMVSQTKSWYTDFKETFNSRRYNNIRGGS